MTAKELRQLSIDQAEINIWLDKIKEHSYEVRNEVMENMKSVPGYQEFIINYSRNVK